MWICMNDSFLSIVQYEAMPDCLLVRARVKGHIEAVFPTADVWEDEDADYQHRAIISREEVADVISGRIQEIGYPNFKNSVRNKDLHGAYNQVWSVMYQLQSALSRKWHKYVPRQSIALTRKGDG